MLLFRHLLNHYSYIKGKALYPVAPGTNISSTMWWVVYSITIKIVALRILEAQTKPLIKAILHAIAKIRK